MSRFANGFINVTNVDMPAFVKAVYDLSKPSGMGWLYAAPGDIGDDVLAEIMADYNAAMQARELTVLRLNYVQGRACMISIWRDVDGQLYIVDGWYEHTPELFAELLNRFSLAPPAFQGA
jgi:hypothetical protein